MYKEGKLKSIRNRAGHFINTEIFREEGKHFEKYGYYCPDLPGTKNWEEYWKEQRNRFIYGYESGGVKITGYHYFYLNFVPIMKTKDDLLTGSSKIEGFPDFWDGDYNFWWIKEIARYGIILAYYYKEIIKNKNEKYLKLLNQNTQFNDKRKLSLLNKLKLEVKIREEYLNGGYDIIVGKARRKGYSYKAAAVGAKNIITKPKSKTYYIAYEKKFLYPDAVLSKTFDIVNFLNINTPFVTYTDVISKIDHKKSSYIEYVNRIKTEKGFFSEIQGLTAKDNSDVGRGKDGEDLLIEESGAFGKPGLLKKLIRAIQDTTKDGVNKTGQITVFGTSGDLDKGSADYADIFYRPLSFGMLPFINIWDENSENSNCGFFHSVALNFKGFYDKNGNSDIKGATEFIVNQREKLLIDGGTTEDLNNIKQENPLSPQEAFGIVKNSIFPVNELTIQRNQVVAKGLQNLKAVPVKLFYKNNKATYERLLDNKLEPITRYKVVPKNKIGVPLMYQPPVEGMKYIIGYDPYRQDKGESYAAIVVLCVPNLKFPRVKPIAFEYVGRTEDTDGVNLISELVCEIYKTPMLYENEVTHVKNYYRKRKKLHLLKSEPKEVISKKIKNSVVNRVYGCHMVSQLKRAAELYYKDWLNEIVDYDDEGNPIRRYSQIYSLRALDESIFYDPDNGNFDWLSAAFIAMIQMEEEYINPAEEVKKEEVGKVLREVLRDINKKHIYL